MQVIDGDGHFLEPVSLWTEFVPASMRDRIYPVYDGERIEKIVVGDLIIPHRAPHDFPFASGDTLRPGGLREGRIGMRPYEQAEPAGWDATLRLAMHDSEDIVAAVIFPTRGLTFGAVTDAEVAVTACRAVNDWAATYASVAPDELYIVTSLPDHFPELAAVELARCVERHGFVAGSVRPNPTVDGRNLDHPDFEVLWSAAVELGVPMCCHNASEASRRQLAWDRLGKNFLTAHAAVHPLEAMVAFATLYQGGVFDRHPELHVGFMEATCGWVPFWLERLHEHWEQVGWVVGAKQDPREVFRRALRRGL